MRKILTVLGARPQFIKASVVSHAIAQADDHREMISLFYPYKKDKIT